MEGENIQAEDIIMKKESIISTTGSAIANFFSSTFCLLLIIFGIALVSLGLNFINYVVSVPNAIIALASLRCLVVVHTREKENSGHLMTQL